MIGFANYYTKKPVGFPSVFAKQNGRPNFWAAKRGTIMIGFDNHSACRTNLNVVKLRGSVEILPPSDDGSTTQALLASAKRWAEGEKNNIICII